MHLLHIPSIAASPWQRSNLFGKDSVDCVGNVQQSRPNASGRGRGGVVEDQKYSWDIDDLLLLHVDTLLRTRASMWISTFT